MMMCEQKSRGGGAFITRQWRGEIFPHGKRFFSRNIARQM
jgi:hypothetical protein